MRVLAIALLLLLLPLEALAVSPGKARRAEKQLQSAVAAVEDGRVGDAYVLVEKALRLDPENVDARFLRALILSEGAAFVDDPGLAAQMQRSARMDLSFVIERAPDSKAAEGARRFLDEARGVDVFPAPEVSCSAEAQGLLAEAEGHFARSAHVAAEAAYARATAACPENAVWWTWYGDVYFVQGEYARAAELFQKALSLEPCYWTAHRFLADAQQRGGDPTAAYGSILRAVSCNPVYDDAWNDLVTFASTPGGGVERPDFGLPAAGEADGGLVVAATPAADASEADLEQSAALLYRRVVARSTAGSPLARRREAAQATLAWLGDQRLQLATRPGLRAWRTLARARADGLFDEAILVLLFEPELAPELRERQSAGLDRLVRMLGRHVAPLEGYPVP